MKKNVIKSREFSSGIVTARTLIFTGFLGLMLLVLTAGNKAYGQDEGQWRQLFNGKDLTGWKHVGPGERYVENGLLKSRGGMGLLYWAGEKFANCKIRVVYQMRDENSNAGVFIRIPIEPREEWMPVNYGYEVQIDNKPELSNEDDYHYTGTLYSLTKPLAKPGKPGPEWNTMEITLDGPRTIVFVNGEKVTDYTEGQPVPERKFDFEPQRGRRPDSGYIGVQNHADADVVFFKEIAVQQLNKGSKEGNKEHKDGNKENKPSGEKGKPEKK